MKTKKAADIVLTMFLISMVMLTVFAKELYRLTLPKVVTAEVVRAVFPCEVTGPDGTVYETTRTAPAIPKEALQGTPVYVVNETEKGYYLEECVLGTGDEADGFVEVTEGAYVKTKVVIGSDRNLQAGQQVLLTEQNEWVELHMLRTQGEDISEYAKQVQKGFDYNLYYVTIGILSTVGMVVACKIYCKGRWKWIQLPVLLVWCVILGFFLRGAIVIPGEWIPGKLIDWAGWRANMARFPF